MRGSQFLDHGSNDSVGLLGILPSSQNRVLRPRAPLGLSRGGHLLEGRLENLQDEHCAARLDQRSIRKARTDFVARSVPQRTESCHSIAATHPPSANNKRSNSFLL
jgi:hypothetical protein